MRSCVIFFNAKCILSTEIEYCVYWDRIAKNRLGHNELFWHYYEGRKVKGSSSSSFSGVINSGSLWMKLLLWFVPLFVLFLTRRFVPGEVIVQFAKSSKGRHSWSSEHNKYDQPAMKMIRNANNSRREINCHWRPAPFSGVALPCRVFPTSIY